VGGWVGGWVSLRPVAKRAALFVRPLPGPNRSLSVGIIFVSYALHARAQPFLEPSMNVDAEKLREGAAAELYVR
jgi:hypothetical protein